MAPKVTPRVRLLLAHAAARGAAGAGQLFHAILSDPDQVLALADAGFDPDILEAAMEQSAGPGATWLTSFLDWLYEDHEEHLTMADLVAWAQEQPELAPVWLAALEPVEDRSELVPEAGPGRALVVLNDDRTALDFVAEQIQEVTGLGPLEAVRLAMVAHDRGHVRVSVPDPERAVRRIARAARVAGYPLQTQVGL